ncbi:hypothetical protein GLOIN_2v1789000 [Rhizophagus irregularis DAOM 181602=DAOM 197198]|nr:hypothetical protein GLOIN_2v1789000 [Rhizophagus irregularis DAOM 181602=DAOM 197198]
MLSILIQRFQMEPIKDFGIQRFWIKPIKDIGIQSSLVLGLWRQQVGFFDSWTLKTTDGSLGLNFGDDSSWT